MKTRHLKPTDIKYLALEGGGGKGFAYLGALQMLEENPAKTNILQNIQGVAGTSVGAITALMISLGMSAAEIGGEMDAPTDLEGNELKGGFNAFFDPPIPRLIPQPLVRSGDKYDDSRNNHDSAFENWYLGNLTKFSDDQFLNWASGIQSWADQAQFLPTGLAPNFGVGWLNNSGTLGFLQWWNVATTGVDLIERQLSKVHPPFSLVLDRRYSAYLIRDMGMFCGLAARNYFGDLIARKCAEIKKAQGQKGADPSQDRNLTFQQHHQIFGPKDGKPGAGKDLLVCGANFSTGTTVLFSHRHTPSFPVADAVRISMSLPIAYKPYVIKKSGKGWPPCGTYIDGGVWNNLPFREVDPSGQVKNTLALRLEIEVAKPVEDIFDVVAVMLQNAKSTGESQVLREFEYLTITLDTRCLSLFDFSPDPKIKPRVTKRSRRMVREYFGWPKDKDDKDPEDEAKTKVLQALAKDPCKSLELNQEAISELINSNCVPKDT